MKDLFRLYRDEISQSLTARGYSPEDVVMLEYQLNELTLFESIVFLCNKQLAETNCLNTDLFAADRLNIENYPNLKAHAVKEAQKKGISVENAEEALELLDNGVFKEDLKGVTKLLLTTLKKIPESLREFLKQPVTSAAGVIRGILKDISELPGEGLEILVDRMNGNSSHDENDYSLLNNTLSAVFSTAPVGDVRDFLVEILEYESIQMAIILYAEAHGYEVQKENLQDLSKSLSTNNLSPLLNEVMTFYDLSQNGEVINFSSLKSTVN